jgi:hypothetical protein
MAASSYYLTPIACETSIFHEDLDSHDSVDLLACLDSLHLPKAAAQQPKTCERASPLLQQHLKQQRKKQQTQQQERWQACASPPLAKRSARRSSKEKQMSGYKRNRLAITRMQKEVRQNSQLAK